MSTCAVMMVRNEVDIIGHTIGHLLSQVDKVIVADNRSNDGTSKILARFVADGYPVEVINDPEVGYYQSRKTTALAQTALHQGFRWVVPCDADEIWYATDGRPLNAYLEGLSPDVQIVRAQLYNHLPSSLDLTEEANPLVRIGWRQREHGALPKVACRLRPDLVIEAGNHSAKTAGTARGINDGGVVIRHFSWRSAMQYVRKIRSGQAAYQATDLPDSVGTHWRMWDKASDQAVAEHFWQWFWSPDPLSDETLIYDPAPFKACPRR